MKIIYTIAGFYRAAGMERILADKANYLAGRGVGVLIVTTDQKSRPAAFPLDASVRRVDLGIDYEDNNGGRFISKLIRYPFKKYKHRRRLANLLKKERPDITISMFCGDESFLPCLPYAGKSILEVHFSRFKRLQYGRKGLWGLADRYRNRKDGNVIRRFDRFVTLTHEDAAYWGNPSNGRVIPNFLDRIPVEPSPLTRKVVLGVGRFSYQKDFSRLIDAWAIVLKQHPEWSDWILRLAGDGEEYERLQSKIRKARLESNVQMGGPYANMDAVYRGASIFALSSRYEGLPMVLLEAQSYGIPAVSFDCKCGPRDVITDGEDGILVPEGDVPALADALIKLMEDSSLRTRMGRKAREHASRWDKETIMQQWLNLFQEI